MHLNHIDAFITEANNAYDHKLVYDLILTLVKDGPGEHLNFDKPLKAGEKTRNMSMAL